MRKGMNFDVFYAMREMKHHFGTDSSILLTQDKSNIFVCMSVNKYGETYDYKFDINKWTMTEMNMDNMNDTFYKGIESLKDTLKEVE